MKQEGAEDISYKVRALGTRVPPSWALCSGDLSGYILGRWTFGVIHSILFEKPLVQIVTA